MKKLTITLILAWLLFLASNLTAQNSKGLFNLKEGDWFEVQVKLSLSFDAAKSNQLFNQIIHPKVSKKDDSKLQINLHYQLSKQGSNGNQIYVVSVERVMAKMNGYSDGWLGYDSYYPSYQENKESSPKKNQFTMEVTPDGDVLRFDPNPDNTIANLHLTEISPKRRLFSQVSSDLKLLDSDNLKNISSLITMVSIRSDGIRTRNLKDCKIETKSITETEMLKTAKVIINDTTPGEIHFLKESGILWNLNDGILLTGASFLLPGNTIVKGILKDQEDKEVTIINNTDDKFGSIMIYSFKIKSDGSFYCPLFLTDPQHLNISIGDKSLSTFMEPGDTLNISGIGTAPKRVTYAGDFINDSPGLWNTNRLDFYSGSAAYNTLLSIEMSQYIYYLPALKDIQSMQIYQTKMKQKINEILTKYTGKASETCIDYFRTKAMYFLAADKLYFFDCKKQIIDKDVNKTSLSFTDYPSDFFAEADTMPILLNSFNWETDYNQFLYYSRLFKQTRLGISIGRSPDHDFFENYYFSQISLSGYPLYKRIAELIRSELSHGLITKEKIEPYYRDFINNCTDPALVDPIKKVHETAALIEIGKKFPISSFVQNDSSIFNLEKFKGKPICLIILHGPKSAINAYKEEIIKFKKEEVNFIIARLPVEYQEEVLDSTILEMQNVTYIELANHQDLSAKLLVNRGKIFMLDKWFRIVDNNAEDPLSHSYPGGQSKFEKSLRKAIEVKRYSKAEKTAMLTIAGWSFGSVLFTFFIGWWFYRIRIRRIKKQEAVKRRIKELEIKAIRSQMNPHFIFNALNSIQSLINGNQFKEANIYLAKFAVLLRSVLNNSEKSRSSLSDELQAVELYCQLEQLRFEFRFEIDIDPEVNSELIEIPGMIIQPLAENAVVHGLSAKGNQGELSILVKRQNGLLCVCVSDNGVGLSPEKIDTLSQKGFGLKLVEERINILNLDGKEACLTVENRQDSVGTLATLTIPID